MEDQSTDYEDIDSDLILEIVDQANLNGLSSDEMEEALEAALLDESFGVEERLRNLRDFFHTKIYKEGVAANRLQRLVRDVVRVPKIMKKIEKMEKILRDFARCARVTCPDTVDSSKKLRAVSTIIKEIAGNLCETYGVNAVLQLTSDHVQTLSIMLQPENEKNMEYTYTFVIKEASPVGYSSMSDEGLMVFRGV